MYRKLALVGGILISLHSFSQNNPINGEWLLIDSTKDISKVIAAYVQKTGAQAELYYGIEHVGYSSRIEGEPYYGGSDWQKGSVVYDGVLYTDVLLKYDIVADELIALHPNGYFSVTTLSNKVSWFSIPGHEFIGLGEQNKLGMKKGFYEVLVKGKLALLAKRSAKIDEKVTTSEVLRKFVADSDFFAINDGTATHITNESSIIDVLGDKGRKIRSYLRDKEINFKKQKETALLEIAAYYNQSPL